ncbi:hypothetical protein CPC08DRAFT_710699 [Agrocybe pediades]|nr:hypothetical protein CPC08DRAFT_710699 [Agrocybe pediades]
MATICNDRITTPLKYIEIGENDKPPLEALERECSDGMNKDHNKISITEGCFITKQSGLHLENLYWVKPAQDNARLQLEVAVYLNDLGLVRSDFSLDKASNITPLHPNLHDALDKQGFFAVTCSKRTLEALIALVEAENNNFIKRESNYIRYFDFKKPPFTDATYELVLLYPHHFLPKNGDALTVFSEHGNDLSGKMYFVSPDGALREGPDNTLPRLPAFSSNATRAREDMLNPFLVALNADIAFRRFRERQHPLCKDYDDLIDLTIELVNKIYFQPLIDALNWETANFRIIFSKEKKSKPAGNAKPRELTKNSRMGVVIPEPGPGASPEEVIKYYRYLMSGCDYEEDSDHDTDTDTDHDTDTDSEVDDEEHDEDEDDQDEHDSTPA